VKLPPDVQFIKESRLFIWRPHGVINESAVNKVIGALGHLESRAAEGFNRFSDTLSADSIELNFKFIFHVSLYRRLAYPGPLVKSAILVTEPELARYSKMHALLTQGSMLKVRIFEQRDAAAKWLGVPNELLEAPPDS
jgi:hypothetical protein